MNRSPLGLSEPRPNRQSMPSFRGEGPTRLAVVLSHPVQYYSPWFRHLAGRTGFDLRVFYLWDYGVSSRHDRKFGIDVTWDVPLLDGYSHEFVPNASSDPGTHHFRGLDNPDLRRRVAAFEPDAILMFGYRYVSHQRLIWWSRAKGIPLLFRGDSHLLGEERRWGALRRSVIGLMYRGFSAFLAVGRANTAYFLAHGVPADRIRLAPHCVDNARFATQGTTDAGATVRRDLGIAADRLVILFAGKFEPKKRPDDLLVAFRSLGRDDADLVLVGSGALEPRLRELASGAPNVHFLPFQNQSRMPAVYAAADLFVLPSFGRTETWGLAVNEAMCCGAAIVVSDHVGCGPDLVRNGENGRIAKAGDRDDLAVVLADALSDRNRLAEWGRASRRIIADYSYEAASEGLLAAMASLKLKPSGERPGAD